MDNPQIYSAGSRGVVRSSSKPTAGWLIFTILLACVAVVPQFFYSIIVIGLFGVCRGDGAGCQNTTISWYVNASPYFVLGLFVIADILLIITQIKGRKGWLLWWFLIVIAIGVLSYIPFANRPTKAGNQFDIAKISVGDQVAGLAIASIEPAKQFDQGTHYSATNAKIAFSGQITVSGTWSYTPERDSIFGRSYIKVEPDAASVGKLPTTGPIGKAAFEIANLQNAKRILNIVDDSKAQRGQATLLIQDFMLETTQTEGSNQATLVQILSRT